MMTPGGEMMCRDKMGNIVATTAEELLLPGNKVSDADNRNMPSLCVKVWFIRAVLSHGLDAREMYHARTNRDRQIR